MAEKHTEGPWNVCQPVESNARSWTAEQMQHMWWVGKRPGVAVALVDGSETHSGEADARLIAAAPDGYDFVAAALPVLEQELEMREYSGDEAYCAPIRALIEQANAFLAKARGAAV